MNKITATQALLPMLKAMYALGPDTGHLVADVQTRTTADMGITATGDDYAKVKLVYASAAFELRQRGCMDNLKSPTRWILTDLGREVGSGALPVPGPAKGPTKRVNASRKETAAGAGTPATTATENPPEGSATDADADADTDTPEDNSTAAEAETASAENPAAEVPHETPAPAAVSPTVSAPVVEPPAVTPATVPAATPPALLAIEPEAPPVHPIPAIPSVTGTAPVTIAPAVESVDSIADRITSGKRMKTASLTVLNAPDWVNDPYLRQLVAINHPCFGGWNARDAVCGECPLAAACRNAQAGVLGTLSVKLREAELSEAAKRLQSETAAAMAPAAKRITAELREGVPMAAPFDAVCAKTGAAITKGEQVVFIPKVGVVKAGV